MADLAVRTRDLSLWYGTFQALHDVNLEIEEKVVTSLIGPSGCGKSTLLRCFNRINERLDYVRTRGSVEVLGHDINAPGVEILQVRKRVGMVFQRPNPLPQSIRDNVLFAWRLHATDASGRDEEDAIVEHALRKVLLWDTVKDRLHSLGTRLSLEEQQKLCIARLIPVEPSVLLMDEPCSALDPDGTQAVEELVWELAEDFSIIMVTHNMAQARRASEQCIFMLMGEVIEHAPTAEMFVTPRDERTAAYIEGRYG